MSALYSLFIELFILAFKLFALFNSKAKQGLIGRRSSLELVKEHLSGASVIWMHAASLGEYEQGLPVLMRLKERFPHHKVLISFFSPSGYEYVAKRKHPGDLIVYLPFDRGATMDLFVGAMKVDVFLNVKYEYWYNLLRVLRNNNTKIFVVSALFYEKQVFFKPYGAWFVSQLKRNVDWFFHQTAASSALAKSVGITQSSVSGDTRYDRVKELRQLDHSVEYISDFISSRRLVVLGSTWEAEEKVAQVLYKNLPKTKLIIAPHDLSRVSILQDLFPDALVYSRLSEDCLKESCVLIIDSIGLLSRLYSYADVAVVGGGFHAAGLHNILEAAVFGKPVFFGSHYKKNPEADLLIEMKGGKSFSDEFELAAFVEELIKSANRTPETERSTLMEMSDNAGFFVASQPEATHKIVSKISTFF